jgi:protease-4
VSIARRFGDRGGGDPRGHRASEEARSARGGVHGQLCGERRLLGLDPGHADFAQPGTITGSIGIFAVVPSFEKALDAWGVNGDGVRTTPLSGQPDVITGMTPEVEGLLQADIEGGYARFLKLVATSRHKTPQEIDAVAQGRVWDGGTARQKGLVDAFGGLDDALAYAAGQAGLKAGEWHADYLANKPSALGLLVQGCAAGMMMTAA